MTAVSETSGAEAPTWRTRAVSRSVDPARAAAEDRVQRFLDAATELLHSPKGEDFTVQNVVDRSGLSLRSFYHHFAGKYELLLAVFEETVRTTAERLHQQTEAVDDPLARLQLFTVEYYRLCRSGQTRRSDKRLPTRAIGQFAHQLLFDHPDEAAQVFAPLLSILVQILDDAAASGAIRSDLDREQVAGVMLQTIMFNAFGNTITGAATDDLPGREELLWELLLRGVSRPASPGS